MKEQNKVAEKEGKMQVATQRKLLIILILIASLIIIAIGVLLYTVRRPEKLNAQQILSKAAESMDKTVTYRAKVEIEAEGATHNQLKEISGPNLHWKDENTAAEQYYIDGTLYSLTTRGVWEKEEVDWSRKWEDVNDLKSAVELTLKGREKVDDVWCYVLNYKIGDIKATDYIKVNDFRYLKAITETDDFKQTTIFYDYDEEIALEAPEDKKPPKE